MAGLPSAAQFNVAVCPLSTVASPAEDVITGAYKTVKVPDPELVCGAFEVPCLVFEASHRYAPISDADAFGISYEFVFASAI